MISVDLSSLNEFLRLERQYIFAVHAFKHCTTCHHGYEVMCAYVHDALHGMSHSTSSLVAKRRTGAVR